MRNSEAQRYARWSAAAAVLLAAVVAGVYLRNTWLARQAEKKAPPGVPSTIEQRSNEFSFSKVEGQRTIYTVRASHTTEFKEGGRNLLEDVAISVFGKKGERNDTLTTKACDFISNTGKISCAGEVQISLESAGAPQAVEKAIQVATSGITFDRDSGEARTEKPVTFHLPAGEGRALGVRYDSNSGTFYLLHDVELNVATSPSAKVEKSEAFAGKALHLTGSSMAFQRETREVQVEGNVDAVMTTNELSAGSLLIEMDATFHPKRFVASGRPHVSETGPHGPIALSADEISSTLKPDGSIESIVATGNVHGTRNSPAGEDGIDAGLVKVDLSTRQNIPHLLTASNGVTLTSTGATANGGMRSVQSDALEIRFANDSRPGETLLESVNTLAPARVEWRNLSALNGKPVPQTMRMSGKRMNLKFDGQNQLQQLVSTGGVEVARKLGDAPEQTTVSRDLTAKFNGSGDLATIDQTGDVHFSDGQRSGQADRAHVDRAANSVALDGAVTISEVATRTTAQTATFTQSSNLLRADGHVLTTELHADSSGISNFAQEPAHVSAEHLVADTAKGHAMYSGNGRLWQGPSVIEADTIYLDSPTHMLVAKGHVRGVFPQAAWSPRGSMDSTQAAKQTLGQTPSQIPSQTPGKSSLPDTGLGHVQGGLLTYWETESRARIEQNAHADSQQGSIQADIIDLFFSAASAGIATKQLSRAVANGDVAVRQEDRRGTSNRAEYTASEGKFVLSEGKPTLYSSTGDTTTGRQLTFFFADDRIVVDSAEGSKTITLHRVEK